MAHDVFISHSRKDKAIADGLCATLEQRGLRCWIAPRDITPGRNWGESIVEAISGSRAMVLVFSGNANSSPQIRREVERAVHHGVPIIPFRVEDVEPSGSLEYFISSQHWLDALTPPLERHMERLAESIHRLLAVDLPPTRPDQPLALGSRSSPGSRRPQGAPFEPRTPQVRTVSWRERLAPGIALLERLLSWSRGALAKSARAAQRGWRILNDRIASLSLLQKEGQHETPRPWLAVSVLGVALVAVVAAGWGVAHWWRVEHTPPFTQTYYCRHGAQFDFSPDDAEIYIEGRTVGTVDDWDDRTYRLSKPDTYYVRFTLRGYHTRWVRLIVTPKARHFICDIDKDLDEIK